MVRPGNLLSLLPAGSMLISMLIVSPTVFGRIPQVRSPAMVVVVCARDRYPEGRDALGLGERSE